MLPWYAAGLDKMKQLKPSENIALPRGQGGSPLSLAELRALRKARKETNERVEELKQRLFRITEQHMDQAIRLIRRWLAMEAS